MHRSDMMLGTMSTSTRPPVWVEALRRWTVPALRQAAFWLAVLLPIAYIPLLLEGLEGARMGLFVVLAALNLLAIVVGSDHTPTV
jgi:hypothetical protein